MNEIRFAQTDGQERLALISAYVASQTGAYDDFYESNLLDADAFAITFGGERAGFCAVCAGGNMTAFSLVPMQARYAREAFKRAIAELGVKSAYVATGDEPFLSLCMDEHLSVGLKAYFFSQGSVPVRAPEYARELLRVAVPEDERDILDAYGVAENIAMGKYYVLRENGVFLGQGFFNPSALVPGRASIGMSVHPAHRQKGVGRSIIMHLAAMCRERGLTPCCGCWYYNTNSRRTLESAGFVSGTRYLDIRFA